jgi:hypothetical protein
MAATVGEIIGLLRLQGGPEFQREFRRRTKAASRELFNLKNAIQTAGAGLAFQRLNSAANELEKSVRKLAATSKLTGASLNQLQADSTKVKKEYDLGTKQANELVIALTKLGQKSGDVSKTSTAIGRLLDLASAQGLNAEEALVAINQAILGIDEGTDKLFQKNPSAIYAEYAKQIGTTAGKLNDQQKAQALLNAVLDDGKKVQGEYSKFLQTAAGRQARLATRTEELSAKFGVLVQQLSGPVVGFLEKVVNFFNAADPSTRNFAAAVGIASVALKILGGAIRALLPALGPVGWVLTGLTLIATVFGVLEANTERETEALKKFRAELNGLSLDQAKKKLSEVTDELNKLRFAESTAGASRERQLFGRANNADRHLRAMRAEAGRVRRARIEELEKQENDLRQHVAKFNAISSEVKIAPEQKEVKAAQDRLDNQMRYQFEHHQISLDAYRAYLRDRQGAFERWSDEWLGIQQELEDIENEHQIKRIERQKRGDRILIDERLKTAKINMEIRKAEMKKEAELAAEQLNNLAKRAQAATDSLRQNARETAQTIGEVSDSLSGSLINSLGQGADTFRDVLKALLNDVLDYLSAKIIAAEVSALIDGILSFNPAVIAKNLALLGAAYGSFSDLRGKINSFADGGIVSSPTLAIVGDSKRGPEIIAPQQDFLAHSQALIEQALAGRGHRGGGTTINIANNTPLHDRRQQRQMLENVLQPEMKRLNKRRRRSLNEPTS